MNVRSLLIGCVLGLSLALVPSCGGGGGGNSGGGSGGTTGGGSGGTTGGGSGGTTGGGSGGTTGGGSGGTTGGGSGGTTGGGSGGTTGGGSGGTTGGGSGGTTGGGSGGTTGGGTGVPGCNLSTLTCAGADEMCFPFTQQSTTGGCFQGDCNVVTQNCATPTDACLFGPGNDGGFSRICVPAGTKQPGEACNLGNECAKGQCVGNKCTNWCYDSGDCADGGTCSTVVSFPNAPHVALACLYAASCDPLTPGSCTAGGEACYVLQSGAGCLTQGTKTVGTSCQGFANECVGGAICVGTQQSNLTCRSLCNRDGGTPGCGDGGVCNPLTGSAYGACSN